MTQNKLEFNVKLTAKDVYNFQTQLLWRRSGVIFIIFGVSYCLLLFTLILSFISSGTTHIMTTLIALTLPFFLWFLRWNVAKKTLHNHETLQEEQQYTFEDEQVRIKGKSFEVDFALRSLKRISYTKKIVLLWQTNTTANIIPTRCLTAEQLEQLKEITLPYRKTK